MPKERRTPEDIANELAQGSAFFRKATLPTSEQAATPAHPDAPIPEAEATSRRHDVTPPPQPDGFDINRETASHDTLRLAVDETRAVEQLKSALKWDFDLTVSKNDICRVALHALIEDYRAKGGSSAAVKRLKKKQGRQ